MKKQLTIALILLLLAALSLWGLHWRVPDPNAGSNGFTRTWLSTNLQKAVGITLPVHYTRIAGITRERIYFSSDIPGRIMYCDKSLQNCQEMNLPKELVARVKPPFITLVKDSILMILVCHTRSIIYYNLVTRHSETIITQTGSFLDAVAISPFSIISSNIEKRYTTPKIQKLNLPTGLTITEKGISDTIAGAIIREDGQLVIDPYTQHMSRFCHYNNKLTSFDSTLAKTTNGSTIDTNFHSKVQVAISSTAISLAKPPLQVNHCGAANNGKLYIHSLLRSDSENQVKFKSYYPIDVYEQLSLTYLGSLKLVKFDSHPLYCFTLLNTNQLLAVYRGKAVIYSNIKAH